MRTLLIKSKDSIPTIWSETNFVEYPYFRLGKKNSSEKEIRIIIQTPSGTGLWLVENNKGLPGILSYEIFTALELLVDRNGITADGKLYFSIKDIISILGWKNAGGTEYRVIRDAIDKIVDTKIVTDMLLFDKETGKKTYHKNFRLLTSFETVNIEYSDGRNTDISMVTFNNAYLANRKNGYVTPVSTDTFFKKLDNSLSRRLYQFLNRRAYYMAKRGECFAVDCQEIGSLMGISQKYVSDINKVFSKAHKKLIDIGFLKSVEIRKDRPRKYSYVYRFSQEFQEQELLERKLSIKENKREEGELLQQLVNLGLSHDKANELIERNEYGVKMVLQQLEYDKSHGNKIKNPAGYVVKFVEDGWIVPEYVEADVKHHKNRSIDEKLECELPLKVEADAEISPEEIRDYADKLSKDCLLQIYKQIFEMARIKQTEIIRPENFNYTEQGALDSFNFTRLRMIFDGVIAERIYKERDDKNG